MELRRYAWISLLVALAVIILKLLAYYITNSVSLLSDALESVVNVLGASAAMWALSLAAQPPDDDHAYGHDKAEFFSSGFEGALIMVAAVGIGSTAGYRLFNPLPIEESHIGVALALFTSIINYLLARWLFRAAQTHESIALEADAHHLISDVISSVFVAVGVILASMTRWWWLDPAIALVVALNIIRMGWELIVRSINGLLDPAWDATERAKLDHILERYTSTAVSFHAVRTRRSGVRRFLSMHVLVPSHWSVGQGHTLLEEIEHVIHNDIPNVHVLTHLEPNDDPASYADIPLHRGRSLGREANN